MTTFDERERAFETQFAHDAEMNFKAFARRDRALGRWAAGLLGKSEQETGEYVIALVREDVDSPNHEAALKMLLVDLEGLADEATIRAKMAEYMLAAKSELVGSV